MKTFKIIPIHPYTEALKARAQSIGDKYGYQVQFDTPVMGDPGILEQCRDADLLVVTPRLSVDILPALPNCQLIALESTGVDCLDISQAKAQGITVCNVPDYSSDEVAERIFAFILSFNHHLMDGDATVRNGTWTGPISQVTTALKRKTLAIYGLGKIGQKVAHLGHAFGMSIIAHTAHPDITRQQRCRLEWVDVDTLITQADVLVLAAPATPQTRHQFNAKTFLKMKDSALLINTARGALIDEAALAQALHDGQIRGAALDVFQTEPIPQNHPLLKAPNTILTPHTAFASDRSLHKLQSIALDNVEAFLQGRPQNTVD